MRVSANISAEACPRCVRAKAPCVPAPAGGRQQKCNRCSRLKHACEADPLPRESHLCLEAFAANSGVAHHQAAVYAALAAGQDAAPALAAWERKSGILLRLRRY